MGGQSKCVKIPATNEKDGGRHRMDGQLLPGGMLRPAGRSFVPVDIMPEAENSVNSCKQNLLLSASSMKSGWLCSFWLKLMEGNVMIEIRD